jgi:uncharacterized repeat protein (TIGR03837 family)
MNSCSRWDIFCAVVDNYGDIGVCWRLARQLANEHGVEVRLWVDDLEPLVKLRPDTNASLDNQNIDGVEVRQWPKAFPEVDAADVIIEAFGCELPVSYVAAMAARDTSPVWINLEYLSAEDWIEGAHGLPSPHPRLPLTKYFFFPGFTPATGGLLREADYGKRTAGFDAVEFRAGLCLPPITDPALTVSLFGYANPALPGLLEAWVQSPRSINCLVPASVLLPQVQAFFGENSSLMQRGSLSVHVIPFLPQQDYDALLRLCDLNFVRGEDSFVRVQWAEKPFVWQIYPQAEATHLVKLEAFLVRYLAGLPEPVAKSARDFYLAWNTGTDAGSAWPAYARLLPALREHGKAWSGQLAGHGDLATNLLHFVRQKAGI